MAKDREIKKALGGKEGGHKLHTHGVHYERAGNGGLIAHVHRHTGKAGGDHTHHHTEEHVLPDAESAQEHLQEHLGDHPGAGEMEPQGEVEATPPPEMAAAGGGGPMPGGM